MGKKATKYLFHVLFTGATLVMALFAAAGFYASHISPYESEFMPVLGLILPATLCANLALLIYWLIRWRYWAWIPLVGLIINIGYVNRMFRLTPEPVEEHFERSLTISTYNIGRFGDSSGSNSYPALVRKVAEYITAKGVDVACFEEYVHDKDFPVDSVGAALGLNYSAIPTYAENKTDLAIYSRYPIVRAVSMTLDDSQYSTGRGLYADINIGDTIVRVFVNHFQTTNLNQTKHHFVREMKALNAMGGLKALMLITGMMNMNFMLRATQVQRVSAQIRKSEYPTIVCGDFNDTPASYTYRLVKNDFSDSFISRGKGYGYTYRNLHRLFRIDYVLYDHNFSGIEYESASLVWSDHNPVVMKLGIRNSMTPSGDRHASAPQPDSAAVADSVQIVPVTMAD